MKIIQNFSSKKHVTELPIFDILIWYVGLVHLKQLGYTTKLYCEKKDFEFLKKWGLFDLYDEIDDSFLSTLNSDVRFTSINGVKFWSARKLFCIEHEYIVSKEQFIYLDTDIVLFKKLDIEEDLDLIVWTIEHEPIYVPWAYLSVPSGYTMFEAIYQTNEAYNCGILWFKSYFHFLEYFTEYLRFTIDNPCEILKDDELNEITIRNIWACNAEQRILTGIANRYSWTIMPFMEESDIGIPGFCQEGIHYYLLRGVLRSTKPDEDKTFWLRLLTDQSKVLLEEIKKHNTEAFNTFMEVKELNDLYFNNIALTHYN